MSEYEIEWSTPYEGIQQKRVCGLEEVVTWLRGNKGSYEWSYDNIAAIRGPVGEVDVHDLMRRADAGASLAPPGLLEAEAEIQKVLGDIRREQVDQGTLDHLDRLRELLVELMPDASPNPMRA